MREAPALCLAVSRGAGPPPPDLDARKGGPVPCLTVSRPLQSDFPSVAMTRSGLSLEELRIVEGQGQSSDVLSPPEEISRAHDLGA